MCLTTPWDLGDVSSIPGSGRSPGGGNGNPLQCSCVGNLMDRGAWWATVHGVAKSWTWLRDWVHKFEDMISEHLIGSELRHLDCPFKLSALKSKCLLQDTALKEHKGLLGLPRCCQWWRFCLQCRRPGFNPWARKISWRMATHSSILAWKVPWTEEPGRLQFMGSQ